MLHSLLDPVQGEIVHFVLPKPRCELVLRLAHDKMGHLEYRKVKDVLSKRFIWPNVGVEVERYCAVDLPSADEQQRLSQEKDLQGKKGRSKKNQKEKKEENNINA